MCVFEGTSCKSCSAATPGPRCWTAASLRGTGLGIYKRKKENTQERKQELVQENTHENTQTRPRTRKHARKKELVQENTCFLERVLVFFLACFLFFFYKFPALFFFDASLLSQVVEHNFSRIFKTLFADF